MNDTLNKVWIEDTTALIKLLKSSFFYFLLTPIIVLYLYFWKEAKIIEYFYILIGAILSGGLATYYHWGFKKAINTIKVLNSPPPSFNEVTKGISLVSKFSIMLLGIMLIQVGLMGGIIADTEVLNVAGHTAIAGMLNCILYVAGVMQPAMEILNKWLPEKN